jgi:4-amino-4-deoxy-L-arabinose transferase-like glycosyltransferase
VNRSALGGIPDWTVLAGFCLVFSLLALSSVAQKSATFDEPSNIGSGYLEMTEGNYWLKPETLPLVKVVAALPLLALPIRMPPLEWADRWRFYDRFLYASNGGDTLLMAARAAVLPLALLLGCLVFVWTKRLFGRGAALFALFLYGFEPNILAHSALVTTDLAVACFLFLTAYSLFRLTESASVPRLVATAFAFALAVTTKLSVAPLALSIVVLGLVVSAGSRTIPVRIGGLARPLAGRGEKLVGLGVVLLVTGLVTWGVIWATYRFSYSPAEAVGLHQPLDWTRIAPDGTLRSGVATFLRRAGALPEPYLYNLFFHLSIARSFPGFLAGEVRQGGWWYYFAVSLLVKTPIPLLILMALALAVRARGWPKTLVSDAFLVVPAVIYFVFLSASGFNMGHRHVLAVLPFFMVLAGALIPWAARQRAWAGTGVLALSIWYLTSSLSIFPHYLAYFNELVGGPDGGYKYLVDSNLDWGQDLKGLKRYMERHGIERVWLSYFGMANPGYYGIRHDLLPGSTNADPQPVRSDLLALPRLPRLSGTVAISATNLQELYLPFLGVRRGYFEAYRHLAPVAKIGYSIFVYRLE